MSKKQFTYLLGAGASAGDKTSYGEDAQIYRSKKEKEEYQFNQVIPTVYDMRRRLKILLKRIEFELDDITLDIPDLPDVNSHNELNQSLKKDLEWFYYMLDREPFVDILAETLFNTNNKDEYRRLCNILSIYLALEQCFNGVDLRYKTFVTSILSSTESGTTFPDCINFLTWNYDYQLEEAIVEKRAFFTQKDISSNIVDRTFIRNSTKLQNFSIDHPVFPIIKLNGSVGVVDKKGINISFVPNLILNSNPYMYTKKLSRNYIRRNKIYSGILSIYHKLNTVPENYSSSIYFSWDHSKEKLADQIKGMPFLKNTETMVVIGYSFPTLNAYIDREILNNSLLRKIYVQCLNKDFLVIKQRIESLTMHKQDLYIEQGIGTSEFFIPYELQSYIMDTYSINL